MLAGAVWGRQWQGQSITVYCDNVGAVSVVNSDYSRAPSEPLAHGLSKQLKVIEGLNEE